MASKAALPEETPLVLPCRRSRIAAVDAENWGKLEPAPALLLAGNVVIWADHAGACDCGVEADIAAPPWVVAGALSAPEGLLGGIDELILRQRAPRPLLCA